MRIKDYFLPPYLEESLRQKQLLHTRCQAFSPSSSLEIERLVLTPAAVEHIARSLRTRQAELLPHLEDPSRFEGLHKLAASLSRPGSEFRQEALAVLEEISGYSRPMVGLLLNSFSEMFGQRRLEEPAPAPVYTRATGGFIPALPGYARFYPNQPGAFFPNRRNPQLVVSIAAGNVPGISILQAFFPLLVGAACLGKNSSAEPYFGPRFLAELAALEVRHNLFPLTDLVSLVTFGSGEQRLLLELVHQSDHLVATGGHDARQQINALCNRLRLSSARDLMRRTSGHWHKVSFDVVARPFLAPEWLEKTAFNVAFDNSMFNTQGCLSCQQVFVEGSSNDVLAFAEAYWQAMRTILHDLPKGAASQAGLRQMYNYYEKIPGVKVVTPLGEMEETPFFAAIDDLPQDFLAYNALNRSILIRRVTHLESDLPRLLEGVPGDLLQSCGAALPNDRLLRLGDLLGRAGVNRIVPPGEIWDMQPGLESWDGYLPPHDLLRSDPGYWTTIRYTNAASALAGANQRLQGLLARAQDRPSRTFLGLL